MRRWVRRVRRRFLVWREGTWRQRNIRCACCGWVSPRSLAWLALGTELVCGHTVREDWHARLGVKIWRRNGRPRPPLAESIDDAERGQA